MDNKQEQETKLSALLAPFVPAATLAALLFIENDEKFTVFKFLVSFVVYYVGVFMMCGVGAVAGGMVTDELDKIHNRTAKKIMSAIVFIVSSLIVGYVIYWFLGKYLR